MNADKIFIDEATDISALRGCYKPRIILIGVCHAASTFEKAMLMERLCDGVLIYEPGLPAQISVFAPERVFDGNLEIKEDIQYGRTKICISAEEFEKYKEDLKQQCNMPMEDIRILTSIDFAREAVDDLSLALNRASQPPVLKKVHAYYRSPVLRPSFVRRGHRQSYKPDG